MFSRFIISLGYVFAAAFFGQAPHTQVARAKTPMCYKGVLNTCAMSRQYVHKYSERSFQAGQGSWTSNSQDGHTDAPHGHAHLPRWRPPLHLLLVIGGDLKVAKPWDAFTEVLWWFHTPHTIYRPSFGVFLFFFYQYADDTQLFFIHEARWN